MSNIQKELLELLKQQATIDDLSNWFSLSQKQIYQRVFRQGSTKNDLLLLRNRLWGNRKALELQRQVSCYSRSVRSL